MNITEILEKIDEQMAIKKEEERKAQEEKAKELEKTMENFIATYFDTKRISNVITLGNEILKRKIAFPSTTINERYYGYDKTFEVRSQIVKDYVGFNVWRDEIKELILSGTGIFCDGDRLFYRDSYKHEYPVVDIQTINNFAEKFEKFETAFLAWINDLENGVGMDYK